MQVYVNNPGSSVRLADGLLSVESEDNKTQLALAKVTSLVIGGPASITTDAIKACLENNIDIVLAGRDGRPYGRVWQCRLGNSAAVRRAQLVSFYDGYGLECVKGWVGGKIIGQAELLFRLIRARRPESEIAAAPDQLKKLAEAVSRIEGRLDDVQGSIMGLEGTAGRIYFESLSAMMPAKWAFAGRSRAPARDGFNCLLNYAYGMLYSQVERACILAGLDPSLGFLHADGAGRVSLVYDLIEPYRCWAERTVFLLFSGRRVTEGHFEVEEDAWYASAQGRMLAAQSFNAFLDKTVRYGGRNIKRRDIITAEAHGLAQRLLERPRRRLGLIE